MDLGFFAYNLVRISKKNDNKTIKPETNTSVLIDANDNGDDLGGTCNFTVINPAPEALGLVMNIINSSKYDQNFKFGDKTARIPDGSVHQLSWTGKEWRNLTAPAVGKIVECYPSENLTDLYPLTEWVEISTYNDKFAKVGRLSDVEAVTGKAQFPALTSELLFEDSDGQSVVIDLKGVSTKTDKSAALQVLPVSGAIKGVVTSSAAPGEKIDGVSGFKLNLTSTANDIFVDNAPTLVPDWYKISLMKRVK